MHWLLTWLLIVLMFLFTCFECKLLFIQSNSYYSYLVCFVSIIQLNVNTLLVLLFRLNRLFGTALILIDDMVLFHIYA